MSVLPSAPGDPGRDLLEQPAVAVRVAEGGVREVRAPGQVEPRGLRGLLDLADVDAAADEIRPGGVDVLDRQVQLLEGPGLHRRDALPEVDRSLRSRRRHLHLPEVAEVDIDVQPPPQALIEAKRPIDIGYWHRHHLSPAVATPDSSSSHNPGEENLRRLRIAETLWGGPRQIGGGARAAHNRAYRAPVR